MLVQLMAIVILVAAIVAVVCALAAVCVASDVIFVIFVVGLILTNGVIGGEQWLWACVSVVISILMPTSTTCVVSILSRIAVIAGFVQGTIHLMIDIFDIT